MLQLTPSAANEILRLHSRRKNPNLRFRLSVQPKGCLDFSYVMGFDEEIKVGDQVIDCDPVQILIDQDSLPYLSGLTLDYSEDLMGGGFRFRNPNIQQSCSCGISFSVTA